MTRELLVVGGGPVGLASAIEARLGGLAVTLIEPRDGAIDKACGEGLMPGALPLLARLGVDPVGMPLRGVSYRSATAHADHLFAGGPGRGVRRLELHRALSARADALGVERVSARVESLSQDAAGVTVAGIRGSFLIGADGLHSSVRRLVGLEAPTARARRFGLRQHFHLRPWSDLIEVHWGPRVEAYVTPVSPDTVGIALLGPRGTEFSAALAGIPELGDRLADAAPASSLRGAGPLRQVATAPSSGRVMLVGDASGYVDAITGEGLRLGFAQARAAVASMTGGASYDGEWRRVSRDLRVLTNGLVRAAASPARAAIVPAARALPWLYGGIVERLAR
ncbi:NAD(P)/FAD-dependent oxidoreductase [soil metagenome]